MHKNALLGWPGASFISTVGREGMQLEFDPRTHVKMPGMAVCARNPSTGEEESRESLGSQASPPNQTGKFQPVRAPVSKISVDGVQETDTQG